MATGRSGNYEELGWYRSSIATTMLENPVDDFESLSLINGTFAA